MKVVNKTHCIWKVSGMLQNERILKTHLCQSSYCISVDNCSLSLLILVKEMFKFLPFVLFTILFWVNNVSRVLQ